MHRSVPFRASLIALFAVAILATPAEAQPREGDDTEVAQVHFERGRAHHERGEYEQAVREYLIAYDLSQVPKLLFNVAQVYMLAGNRDKALLYYEAYLSQEPEGKISDLARERIAEIERALDRRAGSGAREPDAPPEEGAGETGAGGSGAPSPGEPGPAAAGPAAGGPRDLPGRSRPGLGLRIAGLAVTGAGVVGVALGVKYGLEARDWQDQIDSQPAGTPWTFDDAYEQGRVANRNMWIAYGVGAAAVVSGGILYYLGKNAERAEARAWTLAPLWQGSAAGVVLAGEL